MQQLITSAVFSLLVLLLCLVRPNAGRIFLGIFFLVMAIGVNVVLVLISPNLFVALGTNDAIIPLYQWFFENVVAIAPPLFGLLAAAYEITIALMMLSRGNALQGEVREVGAYRGHRLPDRDHTAWHMDAGQPHPGGGDGVSAHRGV